MNLFLQATVNTLKKNVGNILEANNNNSNLLVQNMFDDNFDINHTIFL